MTGVGLTHSRAQRPLLISPDRPDSRSVATLRIRRGALWALSLALVMPWLVLVYLFRDRIPPPAVAAPRAGERGPDQFVSARAGPWGELEFTRIVIEPPEEFIVDVPPAPSEMRWLFRSYSQERLDRLWHDAGLGPSEIRQLNDPAARETAADTIVIRARADLVLGLSPTARTRIYNALAEFPENAAQAEPFRFRADAADEWFADSELSDDTLAMVKRFLYRRGSALLFSDFDLVVPAIESPPERAKLLKTLARKSTLLLRLRVRRTSDIATLARYWGRGTRAKDVQPLLHSIARRPEGHTIDVAHLLPRFARAYLYSYPVPSDDPLIAFHDCHWTSLNFFEDPPSESFSDIAVVQRTLETQYYPVSGEPALGDIIVLSKPGGVVVHSCVYIADEIVFTKNGANHSMPWIFMTLPDLIAFYPSNEKLELRHYRFKGR